MGVTDRIFPESDYRKDGSLKVIRGRVLKKLLKYEFKAILTVLIPVAGVLLLMALLLGINGGSDFYGWLDSTDEPISNSKALFGMLFLMLYLYLNVAVLAISVGVSERRFAKNFFGNEGYLTLTIPASVEEHLFAKHLSGIICFVIGLATCALGLLIISAFEGGEIIEAVSLLFSEIGIVVGGSEKLLPLFIIEEIIMSAVSIVFLFCLFGAGTCFLEKFSKKARGLITFIAVVVLFTVIEVLVSLFAGNGLLESIYSDPVVFHVVAWLEILLTAAAAVGLFFYERHKLRKVNLK